MKATNLKLLSSIQDLKDENLQKRYEQLLSGRSKPLKELKLEKEIIPISYLISLIENTEDSIDTSIFDSWFYSFSIDRISAEFDLVKAAEDKSFCIDLELKSQKLDVNKIEKQLERNRFYLRNQFENIESFTFALIQDESESKTDMESSTKHFEIYRLVGDTFGKSDIETLVKVLIDNKGKVYLKKNIEEYFKPVQFLISPVNNNRAFLEGRYYLTNQQEEIEKDILDAVDSGNTIRTIEGHAGTGKSLLLYDIAKQLSLKGRSVCIVHCGILSDYHKKLDDAWNKVKILSIKDLHSSIFNRFEVICIDEAQRMYSKNFKDIIQAFNSKEVNACIFAFDHEQILSNSEEETDIPGKLDQMKKQGRLKKYELKNRIRTNPELYNWIEILFKDRRPKNIPDCVDILYAPDLDKADEILKIYQEREYHVLSYTPSWKNSILDRYKCFENSHQVIGQEFNSVIVMIGEDFYYDLSESTILKARKHPNPNYLFIKMLYQNVTRARERLAILVVGKPELFEELTSTEENTVSINTYASMN